MFLISTCVVFELLDHEQRSTGIPSNRIILGKQGEAAAVDPGVSLQITEDTLGPVFFFVLSRDVVL